MFDKFQDVFQDQTKFQDISRFSRVFRTRMNPEQSTTENFVYGELGRRPCQFRFRWRQVKFWNRLIGLPQRRLAYKALLTESWNFRLKGDGRSGLSGPLLPERNLTFWCT